jgi:hypothetical protein
MLQNPFEKQEGKLPNGWCRAMLGRRTTGKEQAGSATGLLRKFPEKGVIRPRIMRKTSGNCRSGLAQFLERKTRTICDADH